MPRHPSHDLYTSNAALAADGTPLALSSLLPLWKRRESATSVRRIVFGQVLQGPLGSSIAHQRQWRRRYCSRAGDVARCIEKVPKEL